MNLRHIQGRFSCQACYAIALAGPAIPYRTDASVSTGTFVVALLVTIGILVLLAIVLIFIRRRGWPFRRGSIQSTAAQDGIQIESSRRLSMASTVHVVSYRGQTCFVVESGRGTNVSVTSLRGKIVQDEEQS